MAIFNTYERLLVLAPHTDDGELGAGGLINSFADAGVEIKYIAFSSCEASVPAGFHLDVLATECHEAIKVLGIKEKDLTIKNYPVRWFHNHRQEILEELIRVRNDFRPDLVLAPCSFDVHQDHSVIYKEACRAFKDRTILGYELPWNCFSFDFDFAFELSSQNIEKKIQSIKCYESQSFRGYGDGELLRQLAMLRGSQINGKCAEAYEVIRWVWRR